MPPNAAKMLTYELRWVKRLSVFCQILQWFFSLHREWGQGILDCEFLRKRGLIWEIFHLKKMLKVIFLKK